MLNPTQPEPQAAPLAPPPAERSWVQQARQDAAQARSAWWWAARLLWRGPGVAGARLGLEAIAWMVTITTAAVAVGPFVADLTSNLGQLDVAWAMSRARLGDPLWIVSGSMLAACAVGLHLGLGAWGDALVWSKAASSSARAVGPGAMVARALSWRTLRALMRLGLALLTLMVYVGLLRLSMMTQGVGVIALSGMIYAMGLTALLWLNLSLEYAGARHATCDDSLGESLVEACGLCANKLYGSYKLVVMSATLSAPALALTILSNVWASSSVWGSAAAIAAQALLLVSVSVSVTVFRAASVRWLLAQEGDVDAASVGAASAQDALDSLGAFLPTSFEHVVSLSGVLGGGDDRTQEE